MKKISLFVVKTGAVVASAALMFSSVVNAEWLNDGREYRVGGLDTFVYAPTSSPAINNKRALMVSLHGCAQPNNDFQAGAGWPPVADQYGMVVALPQAAGEGTYGSFMQCWNFHVGMNMSRNSSDAKYLIDLVNELLSDPSLNIDPKQVYLTGLSSGAGMTNTMGCLAPDIFAGVGVNAGPGPGSSGTDLGTPGISVGQGKSNCLTLANKDGFNNQEHLYTQLHNGVHGSQDGSVDPSHLHRNAAIAVAVYSDDDPVSQCGTAQIPGALSGNHGDLTEYCGSNGNPRVSKILVNGMGHAWPAGNNSSGGGNYIDHDHINYPEWITKWFFDNNLRVDDEECFVVDGCCPADADCCPPEGCENNDWDEDGVINAEDQCSNTPVGESVDAVGCAESQKDDDNDDVTNDIDLCPNTPPGVTVDEVGCEDVACEDFTSSTSSHVLAGRAYSVFGLAYAEGSQEYLGLNSIFNVKILRETNSNYYEVGACTN